LGFQPRERKEYGEKPKQNVVRAEVLLNLWLQGMSGRAIAKLINVSSARVQQRLRRFPQYKLYPRMGATNEDATVEKIGKLANSGKTRGDIATELGISFWTVCRIIKKHNISVVHAQFREDLTDRVFGYWQVVSVLGYKTQDGHYSSSMTTKDSSYYWNCKCLGCGKVKPVSASNLRGKRSKACLSCAAKNRHKTDLYTIK
jgi:transposase-like protein